MSKKQRFINFKSPTFGYISKLRDSMTTTLYDGDRLNISREKEECISDKPYSPLEQYMYIIESKKENISPTKIPLEIYRVSDCPIQNIKHELEEALKVGFLDDDEIAIFDTHSFSDTILKQEEKKYVYTPALFLMVYRDIQKNINLDRNVKALCTYPLFKGDPEYLNKQGFIEISDVLEGMVVVHFYETTNNPKMFGKLIDEDSS